MTAPGCCTSCHGSGNSSDAETNGRCWDCQGTGHTHDTPDLPIHRTQATFPASACSTCDGGGCPDCTDPA